MSQARIGHVTWQDITVGDAEASRRFYEEVAGWRSEPVDMGGYADFNMLAADGESVAGVCHARGVNARLPPQWLIYITVADIEHAAERCVALGGRVINGPRSMGERRFCVIQDPAGAVAALITP